MREPFKLPQTKECSDLLRSFALTGEQRYGPVDGAAFRDERAFYYMEEMPTCLNADRIVPAVRGQFKMQETGKLLDVLEELVSGAPHE